MKFTVQQHEPFWNACEGCDECNAGDYGDCLSPSWSPGMLYCEETVEVADSNLTLYRAILAAVKASGLDSNCNNINFDVIRSAEDSEYGDIWLSDSRSDSEGYTFDVIDDENNRPYFVVTRHK